MKKEQRPRDTRYENPLPEETFEGKQCAVDESKIHSTAPVLHRKQLTLLYLTASEVLNFKATPRRKLDTVCRSKKHFRRSDCSCDLRRNISRSYQMYVYRDSPTHGRHKTTILIFPRRIHGRCCSVGWRIYCQAQSTDSELDCCYCRNILIFLSDNLSLRYSGIQFRSSSLFLTTMQSLFLFALEEFKEIFHVLKCR